MEHWHKFDLHHHTLNEITFDRKIPQSNYTHREFEETLKAQGVELKAVTNHNTLNINDHVKHALICKKNGINYLPGVEIDYNFTKDVHAITILNPQNDVIDFSNKLKNIVESKTEKIGLNKDDFANLHENIEYIFIPHVMKNKGIYPSTQKETVEDMENWVFEMIKNGIFVPVIFENTKDYFKYTVYSKIEEILSDETYKPACYVGSDFKFDNDTKRKKTAIDRVKYYMFAEPTYRGLEISVRNHEYRIAYESELVQRINYLESVTFNENDNFKPNMQLKFSPALNVIIGGSGTGKTLLLNEIYRSITGEDLQDVSNKSQKHGNAYSSKIGNKMLLNINSLPENYQNFKVVEIPNIYTEIMKYVNDTEKLGEVFAISNRTYINSELTNYLYSCSQYSEQVSDYADALKEGKENFNNLSTGIKFINENLIENSSYSLKTKNMLNLESDKTEKKILKDMELIKKQNSIESYFKLIDEELNFEYKEIVDSILENYKLLISKLNDKVTTLGKIKLEQLIKEQVFNLINEVIKKESSKLGQKEKLVKNREEIIINNQQLLIQNVKSILKCKHTANKLDLTFPYKKIKSLIETKNSNELARFTLVYTEDELKKISIEDENMIETKNNITKLRKTGIKTINFLDDSSVKNFIEQLTYKNMDVNNIIKRDLKLTLELNDNGLWKEATSVNQGTIAKLSMDYYFNSIINNQQPDIIFIDQPENDVDKDFLTNTLAKFLREKKVSKQIFITSHDAILTVNADANMIIQADVDKDNKISYMSYPLEYSENNQMGTDSVARILDGGKGNIKQRYQIYGGILKYGD